MGHQIHIDRASILTRPAEIADTTNALCSILLKEVSDGIGGVNSCPAFVVR